MNTATEKSEISRLIEIVENLNSRLAAIEASLPIEPQPVISERKKDIQKESSEDIEFRIGEQWFGKIGIVAFLFAVFYLLTLPFENTSQVMIILFGFITSTALLVTSYFKKEQLKSLNGYLTGSGLIILYLTVLKFHYFSGNPVVSNFTFIIPPLFVVSLIGLFYSLKNNSAAFTGLSFLLFGITALLSDSAALVIPSLFILAAASVYLRNKYSLGNLLLFIIPLTYFLFFLWVINNPVAGGEIRVRTDLTFSIFLIPLVAMVFGFPRNEPEDDYSVVKTLMNSVFGYGLFIYVTLNNSLSYPALMNFGMSLVFLFLAARHWMLQRSKMSTFIYSMTGYGALSFAIILNFNSPESYILLCWQSLLVVSTALWFRSRFIIVANFFIFLILTAAYLFSGSDYNVFSLSFGLVSLISARLINIHRLRLELQSEQLRNAYLVIAVLFIPYILYSIIPSAFVGISWIILAFMYYVFGKLINNKKYRLMASATLIMSLVYIFIYGLTSGDPLYKILSFLLVSIALVIISFVYAKVKSGEAKTTQV